MTAVAPLIAELGSVLLALLLAFGASKVYGSNKTILFIGGSILWTTIVENIGVIEGAYNYYGYAGTLFPSYPGYLLWVGLVPLWVELGWITIALSLFLLLREVLLPNSSPVTRAAVAGLLAVNMDAVIDPIAVANNLWHWVGPSYYTLGVPFYNWAAWFLLVFFYTLTFECTVVHPSEMVIFGRIERKLFSNHLGAGSGINARFAFRLMVIFIPVAILLTVVSITVVPPG